MRYSLNYMYGTSHCNCTAEQFIIHMCPDEEKGCSARDLVILECCRAENLLSNDIKYVMNG